MRKISWYDIKSKCEDITDAIVKLSIVVGAWGLVGIIFTCLYKFFHSEITFK